MKPIFQPGKSKRPWVAIVLVFAVICLAASAWWNRQSSRVSSSSGMPVATLSTGEPTPQVLTATGPSIASRGASAVSTHTLASVATRVHPLPVAREGATYQWTVGDGRSDEVIGKIAHNLDEYQRMVEENDRIKDRQMIYCKVTAAELVDRARAQSTAVEHMTVPGMNGQEYQFEIKQADLVPSGQKGTFTGRLVGKDQSLVTLAYKFGRQAFSVMSPEDNLFLEGESYEQGVMVVKSIDPATYIPARCGNDDLIQQNTARPPAK